MIYLTKKHTNIYLGLVQDSNSLFNINAIYQIQLITKSIEELHTILNHRIQDVNKTFTLP